MNCMQVNTSGDGFGGFTVVDFTGLNGSDNAPFIITLKAPTQINCPHCGEEHPLKLRPPIDVHDLPFGDHPVILVIQEGRYRCPTQRRTFDFHYPERTGKLTRRLIRYLQRHQGRLPHRDLAAKVGLSASQVLRIQKTAVDGPTLPDSIKNLGLDDIYINKAKYLVAVNLDTGQLLKLHRLANIQEGRADRVTFEGFLNDLPETDNIALDMHADQLAAARARWPEATIVIDKRHLLQTIDRDLLSIVRQVILGRHGDNQYSARQAVRQFGAAAYPFLYLTSLAQRRRRHLTPADYAAWTLIRQESKSSQAVLPGRILWDAWCYREALYDLYDPSIPAQQFETGLKRWRVTVKAWQQEVGAGLPPAEQPLNRILWAITNHWDACVNYSKTGLTNARTEIANHRLRHLMRTGHRYDEKTLLHLANKRILGEESVSLPMPGSTIPATAVLPEPAIISITPPVTSVEPPQPQPKRLPRHHRRMQSDPAFSVRPEIWEWLHQKKEPGKRNGQKWLHEVLARLPEHENQTWHLCFSGALSGAGRVIVTESQRQRWEAVVHHHFVTQHLERLTVRERQRQETLRHLRVDDWYFRNPALHRAIAMAYRLLADGQFTVLESEHDAALRTVMSIR